ncbi:MAG TPA: hypothetical protein VEU62_20990 [Bryobacterales bacterium]|nr:hypothetical protein [Bryobacterales bacterium]
MSTTPHRALRIVLRVFAVLAAATGLLVIFSSKPFLVRLPLSPPEAEFTDLFLFLLKEMGGLALLLSLLVFYASRDPVRNVAIIDALIAGLCVLAVTPLLSLYTLDLQRLYPPYLFWVRSLARLAIAALLFYLRPREIAQAVV